MQEEEGEGEDRDEQANAAKARQVDEDIHLADVEVHSPNRSKEEQTEMRLADVMVHAPVRQSSTFGSSIESPPRRLTVREIEVLRLLAQGQTNRQIARNLTVSPGTVRVHVQHIIAKLEVYDRTQAAVRASELGLLSPPS